MDKYNTRTGKVVAIFNKSNGTRMCAVEDTNDGSVSLHSMAMQQRLESNIDKEPTMKFQIGDKVQKTSGYRFPGIIVSIFITTNKERI